MKIAHLCLSNFYVDGFAYQENELVRQHVEDGHDVVVIASTETYNSNMRVAYVEPGTYVGSDGARVIRIPYRKWLPHKVMTKLRMHPGVRALLESEAPDVILFHSLCGWEIITVADYKRSRPEVRVFADSHEDYNNSARGFISRYLLHKIYYRLLLRHALKSLEAVLCISLETMTFVRECYGVPAHRLEFYPLGGRLVDDAEYQRLRALSRREHGIEEGHIVFVQTGKMGAAKRVMDSLRGFVSQKNRNTRFYLIGHLNEEVAGQVEAIIRSDSRVKFLGWKAPEDLRAFLCAADFYVQPGSQSATMQMSLCCRCAVILDEVPSHQPFVAGNGWLTRSSTDVLRAIEDAASLDRAALEGMAAASAAIAARILDYRKLAARVYG